MNGEQLEINLIDTVILVKVLENEDIISYRHIEAVGWNRSDESGTIEEKHPSSPQLIEQLSTAISWIAYDGYLGKYYEEQFFNKTWSEQLEKFLKSIRDGQRIEDSKAGLVIKALYANYIAALLQSQNCGKLLVPERNVYSYLFSDILPCRDQILHSEVLRLLGLKILSSRTPENSHTVLDILKTAIVKTELWGDLPQITMEAGVRKPRSLDESIRMAWNIVTLFHEVGRLDESYKDTLDYIQEYFFDGLSNTTGSLTGDYFRDSFYEEEPEWHDHGEKNSMLIKRLIGAVIKANKEEEKINERICPVRYHMAMGALAAETRYLRAIMNKDYDAEKIALELWEKDPLGCLFVTVILLAGLPVRICWNSKKGRAIEKGEQLMPDDTGIYMPVEGVQLCRSPSQKPRLIYKVVEEYAPVARKELEKFPPLDEPRINFLRVALGPKCLQLLSEEKLEAEWDWVEFENSIEEEKMKTSTEVFDFNVFICHSSQDKNVVEDIIEDFKREGVTYWVDHEQIEYGDEITGKIEDGLKNSKYTVVILSKNLGTSNWCKKEYGPILNREYNKQSGKKVIPLKIDDCKDDDIPYLLYDKMRADYSNKEDFYKLLEYLKR